MTTQPEIQWLIDHEKFRQLAYRYAVMVDSKDTAGLARLFHADAFAAAGIHGEDQIAARFDSLLGNNRVSILSVSNHVIELNDDRTATGVVYCRAEIEDGNEWLVQAIVYRDRYVKTAEWQFMEREHLLFYGADMLQRPIGLPPAGKPENYKGKGSMPEIWPTYSAFWARAGGRSSTLDSHS